MWSLVLRLQRPLAFHLSLCLQGGSAINPSWLPLLWYLLSWVPFFCEHARGHCTVLENSCGEGPLFFFVFLEFPQIGLLCHIRPLRLSSGHSNMVLTLRTYHVAHLLWADASVWFTSLLVIAVQYKFFGDFFFFFPVMLFSEFSKLPTDPNCKFSYGVEISSPSWFPPLDRSPSLNPLSLILSFIFCPASFQTDWVGFLGNLVSSARIQKFFVEVAPHSDDILMCLWARKWPPHPTPLPSWDCAHSIILTWKTPWTENPGGL